MGRGEKRPYLHLATCLLAACFDRHPRRKILETLRSNDADGNKNVKNTIGFISKTTALHVHHTFLYISFPFLHDYDIENA